MAKNFTPEEVNAVFLMAYVAIGPKSEHETTFQYRVRYIDWRNRVFEEELEGVLTPNKSAPYRMNAPNLHPLVASRFVSWVSRVNHVSIDDET